MKKMLLTASFMTAGMCSTDVYCSKQKPAAVAPKGNHHPSFLRFWNWAEEKLSMQPKFRGGAENVKEQNYSKHLVNGLLGFITLGIYTPLEARVYCSHIRAMLPIDMQLYRTAH